ncbi:TonB-dependent receptor plug domain-containing protein [Paludibaculum fermentans]|uniref:TonB-dependent receptor n=1 Tax=Paludibaculum fermentans TaxID=1473598 RepID=A0A7S7NXB2_PALFE|nr:TonB-dependent receptor [Paludibaculum fermentans]QOY91518.1 TonB-dependent receptor [Paludibaculum fermentans]
MTSAASKYLMTAGLLMCAGLSAQPAGQEAGTAPPRRAEAEPPESVLFEKMPVVEAASLHAQTLQQAPGNVSIITREDIHRYGYRTLGEAISSATGFYVSYDRVYRYVGVRGFSLPGDYNTRFLVMLNGHYMTENIYGSNGFFGQDFSLDLDLVERIEIIRGPSSVLYGSNGMFATINVVTRAANDSEPRVSVEVGSFGEKKVIVSTSTELGHGAKALISGSVFNNSGQDLYFPASDRPESNHGRGVSTDGERGYHLFANVTWGDWTFTGLAASREKLVPTGWYGTLFNDRGNKVADSRGFAEAAYVHDVGSNGSVRWRVYYDRYGFDGRYDNADGSAIVDSRDVARGDWMGSRLSYRFNESSTSALTVGGEVQWDLRSLQENFDILPAPWLRLRANVLDRSYGVFVQQEWSITSRLQANIGLRGDDARSTSGFLSPRVAFTFQQSALTTFKFLYGRAFRSPSTYERDYADGVFNLGNARLSPENINTWEVGAEHRFGSRLSLAASGYYSRVADLITAVNVETDVQQFRNVARNRSTGVDIDLKAHTYADTEISAGVSFQQVRNSALPYQVNSPAAIAKMRFYAPVARHRAGVAAGLSYLSPRKTILGDTVRQVLLADLTVSSSRTYHGVEFSGGIRNLFNQKYPDPVGLEHGTDRLAQNGISFFLKLTWQGAELGAAGVSSGRSKPGTGGAAGR